MATDWKVVEGNKTTPPFAGSGRVPQSATAKKDNGYTLAIDSLPSQRTAGLVWSSSPFNSQEGSGSKKGMQLEHT